MKKGLFPATYVHYITEVAEILLKWDCLDGYAI